MRTPKVNRVVCGTIQSVAIALMPISATHACTRAVYLGPEDTIITVRSMDWQSDLRREHRSAVPSGGTLQVSGFVLNRKAARELGVTVPDALVLSVDAVLN